MGVSLVVKTSDNETIFPILESIVEALVPSVLFEFTGHAEARRRAWRVGTVRR
jgi:hypothetical protein